MSEFYGTSNIYFMKLDKYIMKEKNETLIIFYIFYGKKNQIYIFKCKSSKSWINMTLSNL